MRLVIRAVVALTAVAALGCGGDGDGDRGGVAVSGPTVNCRNSGVPLAETVINVHAPSTIDCGDRPVEAPVVVVPPGSETE